MSATIRVLFVGDVVGTPGRSMVQKHLPRLRKELAVDLVILNGENSSARGRGITPRIVKFFKHVGVDIITTGNHIWAHREIYTYLDSDRTVLRPANFPSGAPGTGVTTFTCSNGVTVGILNVQGRVFMREMLECPFRTAESAVTFLRSKTNIIFVDFHAETTSEKMGLAYYLDGKVSALVGTHTHVPTADERILPLGTAYQTDLGMVGALNSMLGMQKGPIIANFISQMPTKFEVEMSPPFVLWGTCVEVDTNTGKAISIERVKVIDDQVAIGSEHTD